MMMNVCAKQNNSKGFTLVELLLYVSISAIMILVLSSFINLFLQARVKNQVIAEVDQQGLQAAHLITQTIRNAIDVNTPAQGILSNSASLETVDGADDPTIFTLSDDTIYITEGTADSIALTNDRIIASDLSFYNLSRDNTRGIIRVQFTLTHVEPINRHEYQYSQTFYASANIH